MDRARWFTSNVVGCARCGGDHTSVQFNYFRVPARDYTIWAICPETDEPILGSVTEEE